MGWGGFESMTPVRMGDIVNISSILIGVMWSQYIKNLCLPKNCMKYPKLHIWQHHSMQQIEGVEVPIHDGNSMEHKTRVSYSPAAQCVWAHFTKKLFAENYIKWSEPHRNRWEMVLGHTTKTDFLMEIA